MASPELPTPSRDPSLQADQPPSINTGTAGRSGTDFSQPENYFQPINDNDTLNCEYASVIAASPSTTDPQSPAPADQLSSLPSPVVTPQTLSLQTTTTSVNQCLSNITTCSLTTGISSVSPSDLGASKTPSPQLLLPALNVVPSSHSAETQVQLGQSTESSSEVTSFQLSLHQRSDSELLDGSSGTPEQASDVNAIQRDAKELVKDTTQDKMDCISDDGLLPGGDIFKPSNVSGPPSSLNGSINPEIPVKENAISVRGQESPKSIPDLSSTEADLEIPSVSEMPQVVPGVSINPIQVQHNQTNPSDLKSHVPLTIPEASGRSADYMPVLYLQVTKTVQEETQRATDNNLCQHPVSTAKPSEPSELASCVLESVEKDDFQHPHREQGHHSMGNSQKNPPMVLGSTVAEEQRSPQKDPSTPTKIHQPRSSCLKTQQTHWAPQEASGALYNSYYGSVYHNYQNTHHPFSDKYYSQYYSRGQHAWMDLSDHWPQTGSEAQFYDQNSQKVKHMQKQPDQPSSEQAHDSNHLTLRQKRSNDRSARVDQDKSSPHWSENYAKYYNSGGWNHQEYYPSAYRQDYYYPYDYGYQADVSTSNNQQYNTKPDNYDDWWRYDPRYDSTFDHDYFGQHQRSYWDQCDRQSSHSGYSTQSMPSTRSQHSRISWHSEQSWGYPATDHSPYDVSTQSPAHSPEDRAQLKTKSSNDAFNKSHSMKSPFSPEQFSVPHCRARFGPGGQLIQVLPNLPSEGKPALVQIHNTEMMLQGCWDHPELQSFPGPLVKDKTHKSEVLEFIRKKYQECVLNDTLPDKEASCLIWELIELVCKQNGKLVGTDITNLLLRKQSLVSESKKAASDLIDFTNEALSRTLENPACNSESATEDTFWTIANDTEQDLQCFRELLIFGKKKDALETAINKGLWGHAFMLASKMDSRAYTQVMSKFIDSLPENDPLRTFYHLISGRIPLSASHCGIKEWGDWRVHLAMVLSNHTRFKHLHKKTITRMGDALASKGCTDAASFCYMVVQLDVETESDKSDIFLFGASSLPPLEYASNEAIQRTELFEYALSLGCNSVYLPNFQIFKFIYACRLAEGGLCTQAFQYCEVISKALLASASGGSLNLISQLIELSAKMRHFDQQLKDIPDLELSSEPNWLINLRRLHCQIIEGLNALSSKKQDTNHLPLLEKDPQSTQPKKAAIASYKVSLLTKMPSHEEGPPDVCLVPPAPQDILEKKVLPQPRQIHEPGWSELGNKAVPLPTFPVSQKPSHQANPNLSPVEEPVQSFNPLTVTEPQIYILPSTAALLPERLVHTADAHHLSEDESNKSEELTPALALPLPVPLSLQASSGQFQITEDLQSQSLNIDQCPMEPHSLSSGTVSYSTSVVTESLPQIISPYIESHTSPPATFSSPKSLATESGSVHELIAPHTDSHTVPSTSLSSSKSLPTESESVPQLISSYTDPHKLPSTMLPSSMWVAKESKLPQSIAQHVEPHTLNTTTLPSSMLLTTESEPVPQLVSPYISHHTLPSKPEFESASQLTAPYIEPRILPSTTLPSSMSFAAQSESAPQLTVPLPVPTYYNQMGQHYEKHTQPAIAPPPMASASQHWVNKNNLRYEVQPVPSRSTSMLCPPLDPQLTDAAESNERAQPNYILESQTVPPLTVPLPASPILPPSSENCSAVQGQQVAPPQTPCLPPDPMLRQKPPPLANANPYAMGEKMVHSKQTHMAPKPLIPRLFVPQSPPPDPQPKKETGGGWFSWLFGKKKEENLPADTGKTLVWNDDLQRWVDPNEKKEKKNEVMKVTAATGSGDFQGPTAGLLTAMPALRPGPKRGYMAPLNPVLMSNNPGLQLYASAGINSSEAQMIKPANTYLTGDAVSGQTVGKGTGHMRWTHNSQSVSYPQTAEDILQEIM